MRRLRRVKIVATLGPASASPETVARRFEAGADLFRINMSHTSRDGLRERVAGIRAIEKRFGRPIGVLADLQGPKLRIGTFGGDKAELVPDATFALDSDDAPGTAARICLPHPEILG